MIFAKMVEHAWKLEKSLASVRVIIMEPHVRKVSSRYFLTMENTRETYCLKSISLNRISVRNDLHC